MTTPGRETAKKTIMTLKQSILSSPQKQFCKNFHIELDAPSFEDKVRVGSPISSSHENVVKTFKVPTPVVSPGYSLGRQGIVLRIRFPAGMSEDDIFKFIRKHKLEVVEKEVSKKGGEQETK